MISKIVVIFLIIGFFCVFPIANAQEIKIGAKAEQKSVVVTINEAGNVHVKHIVKSSSSLKQLELIDGIVKNLTVSDDEGNEQIPTIVGDNDGVMILPSETETIVEYDLEDVLVLNNNIWTWDFLYLESTTFIVPEKADLIFVNNRAVDMDELKGFKCHGCQMVLEYSLDVPKNLENVKWENKEFNVEIRSFSDIDNFIFDQPSKTITFNISEPNQFLTVIVPLELLWGPYAISIDDQNVFFNQYINNGTHVWLTMKPNASGVISIVGTTVVPEFPIIAPLAIGFMMIMILPIIRKINRH